MEGVLSARVQTVLEAGLADPGQRREIAKRLARQTAAYSVPELRERIALSILRLILERHDQDFVEPAFVLAETDWRDLLMAAGHGSLGSAEAWAEHVVENPPALHLPAATPKVAVLDANGWVRCPTCHFRFRLTDPMAWDGERHRRCFQRLVVETA